MKRVLYQTATLVFLLLGLVLFAVSNWIPAYFGTVKMEEILFHIRAPLEGANSGFVISFIKECLLLPLAFTAFAALLMFFPLRAQTQLHISVRAKQWILDVFPLRARLLWLSLIVAAAGGVDIFSSLEITSYIRSQMSKNTIYETYYVPTDRALLTFPQKKRNLIYIFLESMETTYQSADAGGAMPVNLIPELTALSRENVTFSTLSDGFQGAYMMPGTGWTVAAMVAQTSGVPLSLPVDGNSYSGYGAFLPGLRSLGDILKDEGYNQTLLIGSKAEFGGRKEYFEEHGGLFLYDYDEARRRGNFPADYYVNWGYEDEKLFEYAKPELLRLAAQKEPFCFLTLTVDTHHIGGYVCRLCRDEHGEQFENVISCSSRQVADFVQWIQAQDFYEDTSIVISGDHLSMDPAYFNRIDPSYRRAPYQVFIHPAVQPVHTQDRKFTTMDMFPSTLAAMGVGIQGERLGLGTNLFSSRNTLVEELGEDVLFDELEKTSVYYNENILYASQSS